MRKGILIVLGILLCFSLAACAVGQTTPPVSKQSSHQEQSEIQNSTEVSENESVNSQEPESSSSSTEKPETGERTLKLRINGQALNVTLYDTPAANALYDMLPLELTFEDFNGIEKISYLTDKLPTEGEPDGCDPEVGDLCLYAPWGNLSFLQRLPLFRFAD